MDASSFRTRPAAVAGLFYPRDPGGLRDAVGDLLALAANDAQRPTRDSAPGGPANPPQVPKALIVPHAGFVYSGATAARAYRELLPARDTIRRVVLLGPAHRKAFHGMAVPSCSRFATPLGDVAVDTEAIEALLAMPGVVVDDGAHAMEHSLEVQLPFLQQVLGSFTLVPIVVGRVAPAQVAQALDRLWGGPETVVIVSSDLSHYHGYDEGRAIDAGTVSAIDALRGGLDHEQACGATPIDALIECAKRRGLTPRLLDICNSGDTAGPRDRVVGYCAFAFSEGGHAPE